MDIKTETITFYIGEDGKRYESQEDAEVSLRIYSIAAFLYDHGGTHYDFSVDNAAEAILKNRAVFLKLMGVSE
jgi:hypothetical protein